MTKEQQLEHALKTIEEYCADIINGSYTLEPGEHPLLKIQGVCGLAKAGLWNPVEEEEDAGEAANPGSP
jgi:hypothetical protein